MLSGKLSRLLAVLRRYISAPEKDRVPDEMIDEFKAVAEEKPVSEARPTTSGEDRPRLH